MSSFRSLCCVGIKLLAVITRGRWFNPGLYSLLDDTLNRGQNADKDIL